MIKLEKDTKVSHGGIAYKIRRIPSDLKKVICENLQTGEVVQLPITELQQFKEDEEVYNTRHLIPVDLLSDEQIQQGEKRLKIIKPFLSGSCDPVAIKKASKKNKVAVSTIYRWRSAYIKTNSIVVLVDREGRGGKGKFRLKKAIEQIIDEAIKGVYLKKKSISKTMAEIEIHCRNEKHPVPNILSVKNRIALVGDYQIAKQRRSQQKAEELFGSKSGKGPTAQAPFSRVQLDHTKLDVLIVDEEHRKVLGRPWLTILIDIFSRMPVGFYISLDPPGNFGTGYALYVSMCPKDNLLAKLEVSAEWPVWGTPVILECDNAGEFHSEMLRKACLQYGITIKFRPVKKPHYGGHIERLIGTFNTNLHDLPGTTYSNSRERKYFEYEAEKFAAFTITEVEQWVVTYITQVYALKKHKGIGMAPLDKYKEGIFGTKTTLAAGSLPVLHENETKLRLDLMPFYERTIQPYGVEIENIHYYNDVLKPYIHSKEQAEFAKKRNKQKFQFKRDPRDISKVFFLDPMTKEYFQVPYANMSGPSMSIWEKRAIERDLKKHAKPINETEIFRGYLQLKAIEERSVEKTKSTRRNDHRKKQLRDKPLPKVNSSRSPTDNKAPAEKPNDLDFTPFEGIEHEAFK